MMGRPRRGGGGGGRRGGGRGGGSGESELHAAARAGDVGAVDSLCEANPLAVNSRDRHSRTPLHLAAWSGHTEVVRCLCKHNADVGAAAMDDTAAIHFASQKGHLEVVRELVASGASAKAANRKGMTPLHFAAQNSHLELVKYLVKKGATLSAKTKGGQSALHVAENDDVREFLEECEQSVKKGIEPPKDFAVSNPSEKVEPGANSSAETTKDEEDGHANDKRKGEEVDELLGPKRAKVSLGHLLSEDDVQDGEEEE